MNVLKVNVLTVVNIVRATTGAVLYAERNRTS